MRKFDVRWWVDAEFLARRVDHNIDTALVLLENYSIHLGGFGMRLLEYVVFE